MSTQFSQGKEVVAMPHLCCRRRRVVALKLQTEGAQICSEIARVQGNSLSLPSDAFKSSCISLHIFSTRIDIKPK